MGACHLPLEGLNHVLLLLIFNTPKGVQGGEQKWGTLCSGKIGKTGLQTFRYSQELILWAQFLHLFISRKVLKSFMVTLFLVISEVFIRLAENWKNMGLIARILPSPKITYILTFPPCLFGAVSHSYLRCCLPSCNPHFGPNKTTCNSHIVHFLKSTNCMSCLCILGTNPFLGISLGNIFSP